MKNTKAAEKTYFVARIKPWHGGAWKTPTGKCANRTYVQATTDIDCLNCGALSPIMRVDARNKAQAIQSFIKRSQERLGLATTVIV